MFHLTSQQTGYMPLQSKWQPWAPKTFSQALVLGQNPKCKMIIRTVEFCKI